MRKEFKKLPYVWVDCAMAFNTIQYCIDRSIPCFTFAMDASKKVSVKWRDINADNFTAHLSQFHNGFAVITGSTHIVIDFDLKHDPPQEIYDILMAGCECVEQTPAAIIFGFSLMRVPRTLPVAPMHIGITR